ncbi:NADH-quinone oxidoreductase subunit NuoE [Vallicoccus soli]|uniref:NADH-quinone oxidoreductase subunit NuoE n=1 Tax=Vallicoccus soli TaxID=2339232 RepID=A0A3A3YRT3_9ACTN|nr:NADH-quinone oxidoreductase subunit NuoE [Vallicoccus soli]RJK93408.1 NADH-quinone oxidoreductase subunit NuoE [Vallicoccus soli]
MSAPVEGAAFEHLRADAQEVIARYPQPRSALLPLLHLVQAEEGFVSERGVDFCAELLGLTAAEVQAVATFYTMYKRRPVGRHHVGVCTNTLCAVLGGDEILARLQSHLGVGNDETTEDGAITLEHIECNAACDYAPVVMVDWEFFDDQTPQSAVELVDRLRSGEEVVPTRGAPLRGFRATERLLAGFYDGRADEGPSAGHASLAGVSIHRQRQDDGREDGGAIGRSEPADAGPGLSTGYGRDGGPSAADPTATAASDPANRTPPAHADDPSTSRTRAEGGAP